jgi:hypothetical protein
MNSSINNMERISVMEKELIENLSKIHENMVDLTFDGIMGEEALRQLSKAQQEHYEKTKAVFALFESLMISKYVKRRVTKTDTSQRQKKMTEREKLKKAAQDPSKFFICDRCNRVFVRKDGLKNHQKKTVICRLIKNTKQGVLDENNITTRNWGIGDEKKQNITKYIADNVFDNDTEEEEEEEARKQAEEEAAAALLEEV